MAKTPGFGVWLCHQGTHSKLYVSCYVVYNGVSAAGWGTYALQV